MSNIFDINSFDINQSCALEASAGTGKTHTIKEIIKKMNQSGVDIDKVLIVTYTEKAAGELRDRIRNELNINTDNASIFTIHSFCLNVIEEFALTANLPLNLEMISKKEINDFCDDYIRKGDILKDIIYFKTSNKFNGISINEEEIKEGLISLCNKYYLDLHKLEDSNIVSLVSFKDKNTFDVFNSYIKSDNLFSFCNGLSVEALEHYNNLSTIDGGNLLLEVLENNYNNRLKFKFNKKDHIEYKAENSPELSSALDFFKTINSKLSISINYYLAEKYLKNFYISLQNYKELNKKQSFNDIIRSIREACLHNKDLLLKLKQKYSHAIIDEAQDTNQIQFDIFSSIFLNDNNHHLIIVGDPKQSIYSFQGADVNVYNKAVELIEQNGGVKYTLKKNYRSSPNIVDSCNIMFNDNSFSLYNFAPVDHLTPEDETKPWIAEYEGKKIEGFWIGCKEKMQGLSGYEYALMVAETILDCCSYIGKDTKLKLIKDNKPRNVSFNDFAILGRRKNDFVNIENIFNKIGIPYSKYKNNALFKGIECSHWIALLEAINCYDFTGNNRKYFYKALFTNFFGKNLVDIKCSKYLKDDNYEMETILKWKEISHECRWEDLIDNIMVNSKIYEIMNSPDNKISFSIYKQLATYCIEYLSKVNSLNSLLVHLKELNENNNEDDEDDSIIEIGTDYKSVSLMTMHASKGLQFPIVISAGGEGDRNSKSKGFIYHENGKSLLRINSSDESNYETIEEIKRLYYVAFTRAESLLVIPYFEKFGNASGFLDEAIINYFNNSQNTSIPPKQLIYNKPSIEKLKNQLETILVNDSIKDDELKDKNEQDKLLKNLISIKKNRCSYKHSYSSLSHPDKEKEENDIIQDLEGELGEGLSQFDKNSLAFNLDYSSNIEPIKLPNKFPSGTIIGSAIHKIFEVIDFMNYEKTIELTIEEVLNDFGLETKKEWIDYIKKMINNVLKSNLKVINGNKTTNDSFALNTIELKDKKAEVEFDYNIQNAYFKNYLNGSIDLLFRRGEYYSILDWKSDKLSDDFDSYSNLESLKNHVDDSYSIQRVLYSYTLINWLHSNVYKNLSKEDIFYNHFGGVYYVFVRGCNENEYNGIYCQSWNSYKDLENAFDNIISKKIGGNKNE